MLQNFENKNFSDALFDIKRAADDLDMFLKCGGGDEYLRIIWTRRFLKKAMESLNREVERIGDELVTCTNCAGQKSEQWLNKPNLGDVCHLCNGTGKITARQAIENDVRDPPNWIDFRM
jgi:hypothetical protein